MKQIYTLSSNLPSYITRAKLYDVETVTEINYWIIDDNGDLLTIPKNSSEWNVHTPKGKEKLTIFDLILLTIEAAAIIFVILFLTGSLYLIFGGPLDALTTYHLG